MHVINAVIMSASLVDKPRRDACRLGVNIGNWTEDREAVMVQQPAVGGTGRFTATSSHRTDFVPEVFLLAFLHGLKSCCSRHAL